MLSPVAVRVPNPKPHTETVLSGKLPLVVQNMTDRAHAIKLLYVPLAAGSIKTVASARLPAHSIERLTLPFQIPASVDPSSLNGTIIAETFTPADPQQFTISVTGQLEPFGDVRFESIAGNHSGDQVVHRIHLQHDQRGSHPSPGERRGGSPRIPDRRRHEDRRRPALSGCGAS